MKNMALCLAVLLSLCGVAAMAQAGGIEIPSPKVVQKHGDTVLEAGEEYYICAGNTSGSFYFNTRNEKVSKDEASTYQLLPSGSGYILYKTATEAYVKATTSEISSVRTQGSATVFTMVQQEGAERFMISYVDNNKATRCLLGNGDNSGKPGVSAVGEECYDWYFFKSRDAVALTVTYRCGDEVLGTGEYTFEPGDVLEMPQIEGYVPCGPDGYYTVGEGSVQQTEAFYRRAGEGILADGYYFMKSGVGDADVWVTSYKELVGLVPESRSFWSVWDVAFVGESDAGCHYTFRNVGNRDVMSPCSNPRSESLCRDAGYLYYDTARKAYSVGDADGEGRDYVLCMAYSPDGKGYRIRPSKAVGDGGEPLYYMGYDNGGAALPDQPGNALVGDHCVKSLGDEFGEAIGWDFQEVSAEDWRMLYVRGVAGLDGHVGGVLSLQLPEGVEVDDLRLVSELAGLDGANRAHLQAKASDAATKYREFVEAANAMGRQEKGAIFAQELVSGRPFYVTSLSGTGGTPQGLACDGGVWKGGSGDGEAFHAEYAGKSGTVTDPATGAAIPFAASFRMKNPDGLYLTRPSGEAIYGGYSIVGREWAEWSQHESYRGGLPPAMQQIGSGTSGAGALEFALLPVVPGIYQVCDIAAAWQGDPYLALGGDGTLRHGRLSGPSSYFMFKTSGIYEYTLQKPGGLPVSVGSYGGLQHTQISDPDVKAYYIRGGKYAYHSDNRINVDNQADMCEDDWGVEWRDGQYTVYLDPVPAEGSATVLQGMQGFILQGSEVHENAACTAYSGTVAEGSPQDLADNNMLHVAVNPIVVGCDIGYGDSFVLSYKATDVEVGTWQGEPVMGVGLGFYHVRRGGSIPAGKCYLSTADLMAQVARRYGGAADTRSPMPSPGFPSPAAGVGEVPGFQLVFRNGGGAVTAIGHAPVVEVCDGADLDALTTPYTLDGRRVLCPKKGEVYVVNGTKVMF